MTDHLHTHTVTPSMSWQGPQGECPWCRAAAADDRAAEMAECYALHAGYEAGQKDAATPAPQGEAQPVAALVEVDRTPVCSKCWYYVDPTGGCMCGRKPLGEMMAEAHPSPAPEAGDLISRAASEAIDRAIARLQKLHEAAGRPEWDRIVAEEMRTALRALPAPVSAVDVSETASDKHQSDLASAEAQQATVSAGTVKPLVWEEYGECFSWKAPLFGAILVKRHWKGHWVVVWSTPGYSEVFVPGHFDRPEDAKAAAEARIITAIETPVSAWQGIDPSQAALDVLAERQRQISEEGWTPEHDDDHDRGELAAAAATYALSAAACCTVPHWRTWPFQGHWWKTTDDRRDLVKSGALILAEIERLDRAATEGGDV